MESITFKISGVNLLMHNERLANPLDPYKRALQAVTKKAKKTEDDHEEMARLEMLGGLYCDETIGPYLPDTWLLAAIRGGARLSKKGKEIERGVLAPSDRFALQYKGPRDADTLSRTPAFRDMRTVRNQQNRVLRTRPLFQNWTCEFTLLFDPTVVERDTLIDSLDQAGRYIGIGDYRPRFGRFTSEVVG